MGLSIPDTGVVVAPGARGGDPIDRYAREMGTKLSAITVVKHRRLLTMICGHCGVDSPLSLTHELLVNYIDEARVRGIQYGKWKKRTIGLSTIRAYLSEMQTFFQWAMRAGIIQTDPTARIERPPRRKKTQRAFSLTEVQGLIAAAEADESSDRRRCRHRCRSKLYRFLAITGCRIGEAEQLRWSDCDLENKPPRITIRAETNHARRGRELMMTPEDADWLRAFRGLEGERDLVFGRRPADYAFQGDMRAAGVPRKDKHGRGGAYHCFRRFVGTELARLKMSPKETQVRLGHEHVTTTMDFYTDEMNLTQERVATALTDSLKTGMGKTPSRNLTDSPDVVNSPCHREEPMHVCPPKTQHFEAPPVSSLGDTCGRAGGASMGSDLTSITCRCLNGGTSSHPNRAVADLLESIARLLRNGGAE